MEATSLPSGTVYPVLRRLEKSSLIRAEWERESIARAERRPARRYYETTRAADAVLATAATRYRFPEVARP